MIATLPLSPQPLPTSLLLQQRTLFKERADLQATNHQNDHTTTTTLASEPYILPKCLYYIYTQLNY